MKQKILVQRRPGTPVMRLWGARHLIKTALVVALVVPPLALALLGDVNDDGQVNETDASWIMEFIAGSRTLDSQASQNADVDDTGGVDVVDAQWILKVAQGVENGFPEPRARNSSPVAVSRDGKLVAVVNPDGDSVTLLSGEDESVLGEVVTGGEPIGVDFSRDGKKAYVVNGIDRTVSVIDTELLVVVNQIDVGAEPFGIVVSPRGDRAYVSNMMSGSVSVIDMVSEVELTQVAVSAKPQGMAIDADSGTLYVTHLTTPLISVVHLEMLTVTQMVLSESPFDALNTSQPAGVANRIKGIALRPGTSQAWVPHILSNVSNSVEILFDTAIFPAVSVVDTNLPGEIPNSRMTLFNGMATTVAHPEAVAFSLDGALAYTTNAASDDVVIFNASTRQQIGLLRDVGDNPRGIMLHPSGQKAYVFSRLSPVLSVLDLTTETVSKTVTTSTSTLPVELSDGRRSLLSSASSQLSRDRFMACASCHFDGRDDGQTWLFSNGPRQTQTLAGDSRRSGLQHHNGDRLNLQDFAIAFTGLQGGSGLTPDQLDNMAEYSNVIRFLDNQNVEKDGAMSDSSRRGRRLFESLDCESCHSGPMLTDADGTSDLSKPLLRDVGTFVPGTGTQDGTDRTRDQPAIAGGTVRPAGLFETSYLIGINATPPYLHAGTAATLQDTLTAAGNPSDQHGATSGLTPAQIDDLASYMNALDIRNRRVRVSVPADGAATVALPVVRGSTFDGVESVSVFINGAGPISATLSDETFEAVVPVNLLPGLSNGSPYEISVRAVTSQGRPGRDDIEVIANFGSVTSAAMSQIEPAEPLLIADAESTVAIVLTPRDSSGALIGSGLVLEAQTSTGSLGAVTDLGDGRYQVLLTSSFESGSAIISANVVGQPTWAAIGQVTITAGDVDPATSSITAAVLSLEADGLGTAEITVIPRDAFGNNLGSGQNVQLQVSLGGIGSVTDLGDGRYTAIYTAAPSLGTAAISATVNGVLLNLTPQISLEPDISPPPVPNVAAISFSAVQNGSTTITGGANSVEGLATVRVENLSTGQFALATAGADGSFTVQLAVGVNQQIQIRVDDIAGNIGATATVTPFALDIAAITGVVRTAQVGGGFTPVAGATVVLFEIDLSGAPNIVFNPLAVASVVTGSDGRYDIPLPLGFVPDPELVVATGPDANSDGFIESFTDYAYVNNTQADVTVDAIGSSIINSIANNFFWLNGPAVPASHFTATERIDINSTLRAATTEIDFFGLDPSAVLGAIGADVFFDAAPDGLDSLAKSTFELAAQSPGDAEPPVTVTGRLTIPDGSGGDIALANVQVHMGTLLFENPPECTSQICVNLITGAVATTDANGDYSLVVPGFVDPGTTSVIIALGDLTYNSTGVPGPFNSGGPYSLAGFYLDTITDIDIAGRSAANLIQLQNVPIENFNATEMEQLLTLVRTKVAGFSVVTANKTLAQVFFEIFNLLAVDIDVVTMLNDIADPQQNSDTTTVVAAPAAIDADGVSQSIITVEPRDQLAQLVGPGRFVELAATSGSISSPAIDNGDGSYTAFLTAPENAGSATVSATLEGVTFDQQPVVTFIADVVAPQAPVSGAIVFLNVGSTTTVIGLAGAVEALSQVTIANVTLGLTVVVTADEFGGFRADVAASLGHMLVFSSEDSAGNISGSTNKNVDSGLMLPAISNPVDIPVGASGQLTVLSANDFDLQPPAGYSFLAGVEVDLGSHVSVQSLSVIARSTVPVATTDQVVLVQQLKLSDRTVWRLLAPVTAASDVLVPQISSAYVGVRESATLAFLSTSTETSLVHGVVSGSRGPIGGALASITGGPFEDLSRIDGRYLLAAPVSSNQYSVNVQGWLHRPAQSVDALMSYSGSVSQRDISVDTRADTTIGFTHRAVVASTFPNRVYVKPAGDELYLLNRFVGDLDVVNVESFNAVSLIDNPQSLRDLSFTPNGKEAFMAAFGRLRELNIENEQLGLQGLNGDFPEAVAITPDGELALVAVSIDNNVGNTDADKVTFFDTFANVFETQSVTVGPDPSAIAINRAGDRAYVTSELRGTLSVIDIPGRVLLEEMPLGTAPSDLVVSRDGQFVYVVDASTNDLLVVTAANAEDGVPGNEVLSTLAIGAAPGSIALHPDGETLFVTEEDDDTVSVISQTGPTVTEVWAASDKPTDLAIHSDGTRAYYVDTGFARTVTEVQIRDADQFKPVVVDIGPVDRRQQLLQDSPVEIVFSEVMDASNINLGTISIVDDTLTPVPGSLALTQNGLAAVFTPAAGTRYKLNSTINVSVNVAPTDSAGNALEAAFALSVPTFVMQLPDIALINVDITTSGIVATGQPGSVEPQSKVIITNLTNDVKFRATAEADGSFSLNLIGLDTDGYELVTEKFTGRASTNPDVLPVGFTIQAANPALVTFEPGSDGQLRVVGAPGAVDVKTSRVEIKNALNDASVFADVASGDGSFSVLMNVDAGVGLEIITTLLGSVTLNPVALTGHSFAVPSLSFVTPNRFPVSESVLITVVGDNFGLLAENVQLQVNGQPTNIELIDVLENSSLKAVQTTFAAGGSSGSVRIKYAGQLSNSLSYEAFFLANTDPIGVQVINATDPATQNNALGFPDNAFANLGDGGSITLGLGMTVRNGSGADIRITENTSDGEDCYEVLVSAAQIGPFTSAGVYCGTSSVQLPSDELIRFVQIIDQAGDGGSVMIDAVQVLNIKISIIVNEVDSGGNVLRQVYPPIEKTGISDIRALTVEPSVTDAFVCTEEDKMLSVTVEPPIQRQGYYGPPGCDEEITWSIDNGMGMLSPTTGGSSTFTAEDEADMSSVKIDVSRTGDGSCADSGSATVNVSTLKIKLEDGTGEIPVDEEIHGIATDALDNNGTRIEGGFLNVELEEGGSASMIEWGYLDDSDEFAVLDSSGRDGEYDSTTGVGPIKYSPPFEQDIDGGTNDLEREVKLAAKVTDAEGEETTCNVPLALVKPPVVAVHGINSSGIWIDAGGARGDMEGRGFKIFAANHNGVANSNGNGDIRDAFNCVKSGMGNGCAGKGIDEALKEFRDGTSFGSDKKIVVKKVDIIAHSYGGLLSRWYSEQSGSYDDDVRKIITNGTPHRGSPLTNMLSETFSNLVFRNAATPVFVSLEFAILQAEGVGAIRWLEVGGNIGASTDVVPALQVMTHNSQVLGQLNSSPFRDDVAYAAIVGNNSTLGPGLANAFDTLVPMYDNTVSVGTPGIGAKSYFPWVSRLDGGGGQSDAIVPLWSQQLPARQATFNSNHIGFQENDGVRNQWSLWLQDKALPLGGAHRGPFNAITPPDAGSRNNALRGALNSGGGSTGGGVHPAAIVTVRFSAGSPGAELTPGADPVGSSTPYTAARLGPRGGIVNVAMTGMAEAGATVNVIRDDFGFMIDENLHNGIGVSLSGGAGVLRRFTATGTIGRTLAASVVGPNGAANSLGGGDASWQIGFNVSAPNLQSPPYEMIIEDFVLPPPIGPSTVGSGGSSYTVEGGAETSGSGSMNVRVRLIDDKLLNNATLVDLSPSLSIPSNSFNDAVIPYSFSSGFNLFLNGSGDIAGAAGSSGDTSIDLFQELVDMGLFNTNISSTNIAVTAAP